MAVEFKDYYRTLGVERTADARAIKSAYRKLARRHHPDVAKGKDAADRFREINEAYEVLSDPEKRRRYDSLGPDWQRYAEAGSSPGGGFRVEYGGGDAGEFSDFSDFFRTIFGDLGVRMGQGPRVQARPGFDRAGIEDLLGGRGQGGRRGRGADVQAAVEITLEEAYAGARRSLAFDIDEPCPTCEGAGNVKRQPCASCEGRGWRRSRRQVEVKIPAGVQTGQRVRISGEGAGQTGGRGDLYLAVTVAPHPMLERRGDDIAVDLPVTAPEAALGATVEVPTLRGRVSMKIPAGTSSGRTFRLPGYGMPRPRGGGAGDQLVTLKIVVPANPTPAERELYERLRALRGDSPRADMG